LSCPFPPEFEAAQNHLMTMTAAVLDAMMTIILLLLIFISSAKY
jgi:hypothetical protein